MGSAMTDEEREAYARGCKEGYEEGLRDADTDCVLDHRPLHPESPTNADETHAARIHDALRLLNVDSIVGVNNGTVLIELDWQTAERLLNMVNR
jgi:hypothetical protein